MDDVLSIDEWTTRLTYSLYDRLTDCMANMLTATDVLTI